MSKELNEEVLDTNEETIEVLDDSSNNVAEEQNVVESASGESNLPAPEEVENLVEPEVATPPVEVQPPVETQPPVEAPDVNPFENTMIQEQGFEASIDKDEKPKRKKNKALIIMLAFLALLLVGGVLFYKLYWTNPKRVMANAMDKFSEKIENVLFNGDTISFGDNYTMTSRVDFDIESGMLSMLAMFDEEMAGFNNLIQNLSKTENEFTLEFNRENEEMLVQFNSELGGEELINVRYFAQRDAQYLLFSGLFDQFIKLPNGNLFELLEEGTTDEEWEYLYHFIYDSFRNNVKSDYFEVENVTTTIGTEEQSVRRITLVLNDDNMKEILTGVLEDIENSTKAREIIEGIEEGLNLGDIEVDESSEMFGEEAEIRFNVYVSRFMFSPKMYSVEMISQDWRGETETFVIRYVESYKEDTNLITMSQDDEVLARLVIKTDNNRIEIDIQDDESNSLGKVTIIMEEERTTIVINVDVMDVELELSIITELNALGNYQYDLGGMIRASVTAGGVDMVNLTVTTTTEVRPGTNIDEDVSEAISGGFDMFDLMWSIEEYIEHIMLRLMS